MFQKCSGIKIFLDNRGITIFSNFFVSHRQKSSWANRYVFQKYSGINTFCIIGVSRFCRLCLSHRAEIYLENPSMIQKNRGIQKFYSYCGSFRILRGKVFVSLYRKNSWGTLLYFRKVLVRKKVIGKKAVVTFLRRKIFVSRRRKTSWANPSVFPKKNLVRKKLWIRRGCHVFRRKLFVQNRLKTTWANPSVFQKGSGIKKFLRSRVSRFC